MVRFLICEIKHLEMQHALYMHMPIRGAHLFQLDVPLLRHNLINIWLCVRDIDVVLERNLRLFLTSDLIHMYAFLRNSIKIPPGHLRLFQTTCCSI